jgi:hypothetical protein
MMAEMARRARLRAGMANGGIIAFKKGEEVEDRDRIEKEKNKPVESEIYEVPNREISSRPVTGKTLYNPNKGADEAREERLNKIVEQRKQIDAEGNRILAERDLGDMNKGIVAAADKVSPVPKASAPAVSAPAPAPAPVTTAPAPDAAPSAGLMNAKKLATALGRDEASPATKADANIEEEDAGIYGLSSKLPAELKDELRLVTEQQDTAGTLRKSTPQLEMQKREDELTAIGLPSFYSKEQDKIKAKRLANTEQAKSDAEDRLYKFLINWGRTPGSTLRGIVEAGYELSNQQGLDKKEQRRMEKELDDVSSSLDKAEYERKIGDYEKAKESITKAGQQYYELGIKKAKIVADYKIKTMESADKLEIARLKIEAAGNKQANRAAIIQQADEYFKGLVAEGKPANAITYKQALIEVNAMQPSVRSAEIGLPPKITAAGADVTRATTGEKDAATRASDAKRKQLGDFKDDLYDALRDKGVKKELNDAKTPEAKADIKNRVKKQVLGGFDLLTSKDVGLDGATTPPPASNRTSTIQQQADAILSGGR